jgi:hypothetical protein
MLNLLGDIFLRSRHVTEKEFIDKLERRRIGYTVKRIDTGTYIEVGRFGYRFNEQCRSRGGWVGRCGRLCMDSRSLCFTTPRDKLILPGIIYGSEQEFVEMQ